MPNQPDPAPPFSRVLLIATRETLFPLAAQIKAAAPHLKAAGAIVLDGPPTPTTGQPGGQSTGNLPILGGLQDLPDAHRVLGFTLALVSLPSSRHADLRRVHARLKELGIAQRTIPPLLELLESETHEPTLHVASHSGHPEIDVAQLIGRVPFGIDRRAVSRVLEGQRVLITGAGGSIGSELARIAATFGPESLVLMDRSENSLFEIDRQIAQRFPGVRRQSVLHDVVDADETLRRLVALKPHVVFHAAAHKHVPLMEDHPAHAVTNNLFGTRSIADASMACGAKRFVLISSDKAVNPTSVMGATKRLAEMYVQSLSARGQTKFSMVRFGNVLGSACSVLPIWSSQLREGGPITVTDPRMTRYFMTIHEAAALVIQSAAIDPPGGAPAVFVLDMGEPVRILDLALRFVRAAGFEPRLVGPGSDGTPTTPQPSTGRDMDVRLTGARPGEKLHEELAYAAENLVPTPFPGIRAWAGQLRQDFDAAAMVAELSALRSSPDAVGVVSAIARWVPEMSRTMRTNAEPKAEHSVIAA